jgi:hypothetical protein
MRLRLAVGILMAQLLCGQAAMAAPASGPRQEVDQSFTTKRPGAATGIGFDGRYHGVGDPESNPPFLRRMVFKSPRGFRYDTSVPERCTASDAELSAFGPAACPTGSRIGDGKTQGIFFFPFSDQVFDRYTHNIHLFNNKDEQIILVESEGYTVVRGKIGPANTITLDTTTCFPAPPPGQSCADDYIMQLGTQSFIPRYVKDGHSYATTPPRCPKRRYWRTTIHFEWTDGNVDDVVSRQPCKPRRRAR